jgi:hypothetical protein
VLNDFVEIVHRKNVRCYGVDYDLEVALIVELYYFLGLDQLVDAGLKQFPELVFGGNDDTRADIVR